MFRLVAFGVLAVAAVTGAGWLYETHHLAPVNFEQWSMMRAIRDLGIIAVALIWLFYPSRALAAVAMAAVFVTPLFTSLNPPDLPYAAASVACIVLAVLATQLRRGIPSPFTKHWSAPTE